MLKAKKYDWKDSNMALFGSDTEKKVKKESAESEEAWQGAGEEVGLKIWRIVKFKVTDWPKEDYGKFYEGDSYIILNTYKEDGEDEIKFDVHFWIGKYSSQDEYGTAAYKTVELDTFLDDKPIQHREVMGHESELFKSYFDCIETMKGGAETGFRRVEPKNYQPRLLHICKESSKRITVTEVPLKRSKLTSDDVFVLDLGQQLYQWHGGNCSHDEKFKASVYVNSIKAERSGPPVVEILEEKEVSPSHPFYKSLRGEGDDDDDDDDDEPEEDPGDGKELFQLSDASGSIEFNSVQKSEISMDHFNSADVYILDTTEAVFVWVGKGASIDERKNGLSYAHKYLMKTSHSFAPITVVSEGRENARFKMAVAA